MKNIIIYLYLDPKSIAHQLQTCNFKINKKKKKNTHTQQSLLI